MSFLTVYFLWFVSIITFVFVQSSLATACSQNDTNNALQRLHFADILMGESEQDNSIFSFLRQLIWTSNHHNLTSNINVVKQDCMMQSIEDRLVQIERLVQTLSENALLDDVIDAAQKLFDSVHHVYYAFKMMMKFNEPTTRSAMRQICRKRSPHNVLQDFSRRVGGHRPFFHRLMQGTGYSETLFKQISSLIITEVAISAILAPKCHKIRSRKPSKELMKSHEQDIQRCLIDIEAAYTQAKADLRANFHPRAEIDLRYALQNITTRHFLPQQAVDYIQMQVAEKYPFRAWAVLLYKKVRMEATSVHKHEGSGNNWFHIQNHQYTAIAHSSDTKANCSIFGTKIQDKKVQDFFQNKTDFMHFVKNGGDLSNAIALLKEQLLPELPQSYFISIVNYRNDLKIATNSDREFHFFEHVRLTANDVARKTVLIGWC